LVKELARARPTTALAQGTRRPLTLRDCRLNGGTGWSEIREESDHD
jgi:hypothetical protein